VTTLPTDSNPATQPEEDVLPTPVQAASFQETADELVPAEVSNIKDTDNTPSVENSESMERAEEEAEVIPTKSYNLDFLDKLDDPNFNPFETKTAVLNNFDSSAPVVLSEKQVTSDAIENSEQAPNPEPKVKKPPVRKPMVRKPLQKKPIKKIEPVSDDVITNSMQGEEEDTPAPPTKSYNLDFLDNMDDPNFNPFETKTAVKNNFEASVPGAVAEETPAKVAETADIVENKVEEPKKKAPVSKPWLKKPALKKKVQKPPAEDDLPKEEDDIPVPAAKGYNMDFLDNLDDPNFNPFETKLSVVEKFDSSAPQDASTEKTCDLSKMEQVSHPVEEKPDQLVDEKKDETKKEKKPLPKKPWLKRLAKKKEEPKEEIAQEEEERVPVPGKSYNLDFLDNLDDPNFNPFETKSSVVNAAAGDNVTTNQSEPTKETVSELPEEVKVPETERTIVRTDTVMFEEAEARIQEEEKNMEESKVEEVSPCSPPAASHSSGYSTLPRSTHQLLSRQTAETPDLDSSLCLPEPLDMAALLEDDPGVEDEDVPLLEVRQGSQPLSEDEPQFRPSDLGLEVATSSGDLTQQSLVHQARLLEKDRELAKVGQQVRESQKEVERLRAELASSGESNRAMMGIVEEFEKTISQLISEKERESVCNVIARERLQAERGQILDDLQSVERAFNDLHRKYERTKEVVAGFKTNEDILKRTVEDLTSRYKKGEEKYEMLKDHAEMKLSEANSRMEEVMRSKGVEVARLTAQLRKAEMMVSSLERQVDQKTRENEELTTICDELISKVGS